MGSDCDSESGICGGFRKTLHCIFKREYVFRFIFVITSGILLYAFLHSWCNDLINPLISSLFSYKSIQNWCYIHSYGVNSDCRDPRSGIMNEQCQQKVYQMSSTITCSQADAMGGIVVWYGRFLSVLTEIFWAYVIYRLMIRIWTRRGRRHGHHSGSDISENDCPSPRPRRRKSQLLNSTTPKSASNKKTGSHKGRKRNKSSKPTQLQDAPVWVDGQPMIQPDFGPSSTPEVNSEKSTPSQE